MRELEAVTAPDYPRIVGGQSAEGIHIYGRDDVRVRYPSTHPPDLPT
jgi:hypothetical protein